MFSLCGGVFFFLGWCYDCAPISMPLPTPNCLAEAGTRPRQPDVTSQWIPHRQFPSVFESAFPLRVQIGRSTTPSGGKQLYERVAWFRHVTRAPAHLFWRHTYHDGYLKMEILSYVRIHVCVCAGMLARMSLWSESLGKI